MISWIYAFLYKQGDCIDVLDVVLSCEGQTKNCITLDAKVMLN